jgi:alkanesulfonate monooxygenase SsuD/methylene tetrahydromethanopterin reductase-like flavin-dependent oxidoreductase (luciferase family)
MAELAHDADEGGWDGVFVSDHVTVRTDDGPQPVADPWIALAAIAMATKRVHLGPMVAALPRRRPWQLATETATLDQLSNGRLILGVGSGSALDWSFAPFDEEMDLKTRAEMLDEGLDLLAAFWSGEPVNHDGKHYQVHDAQLLPRPVQTPRIPVWVAGTWPHPRPFRRAARWDGFFADVEGVDWTLGQIQTPDHLRAMVDFVRALRPIDETFDVVIGGSTPRKPAEGAAFLAPYVAAGLTCWIEAIHPMFGTLAEFRTRLRQGPPRR